MNSILASLNDRQREAVQITEGPLIVLAGAGSGKTKMLTSRIAYLIEVAKVPSSQILAVTFTNKAAAEMRTRVEKTLANSQSAILSLPEIGTFHSICIRILRREIVHTPFTKPFVIYDDSDQLSLIKGVFKKLSIDEKTLNPKIVQSAINRAKCDALEPHEIEALSHDLFTQQVKRIYEHYQKDLFDNHAIDFGEIICLTYRLFRDSPELREKYQKRFRYIHVDEYQDTNRAQYLLLSSLANIKQGGHQNICVVGDEDQSIYKWRGADIRNILNFEQDYPGASIVKLEQNYRSTQNILGAANQVIRNNFSRKDKTLWTENEAGRFIIRAQLPDERAEAEMVVSELKRLAVSDHRTYGDFAIFYRTNAQSRQFEDVLRREKIPYQVIGGLRFYDRKEIKDILAYFKVVQNSADSVSLKRIINVPARGIGKTTLDKLDQIYAQTQTQSQTQSQTSVTSYWSVLKQAASNPTLISGTVSKKLSQFVQMIERFVSEQPKLLLSELYHLILDETRYVAELREEGTEEALSRIENLEEFNTLLQEFEEEQMEVTPENEKEVKKSQLLSLFIEQSTLASDVDQLEGEVQTVKLMTLHSSKGLEFPVVFMVGMEEGLFPSTKAWEESSTEDLEEERRLCYVGMTRAREILYLMSVIIRRIWGEVSYQEPSRFFMEIPDELMEFKDFSHGLRATEFKTGSSRQFGYISERNKSYRSSLPTFECVGRQLQHPEYGRGTIVASEGTGTEQRVTIQFRQHQQRKFLLRYVASYFCE